MMLDMPLKDIERVLYFEYYIVTEPGLTPLKHTPAAEARMKTCASQEDFRRRQLHGRDRR